MASTRRTALIVWSAMLGAVGWYLGMLVFLLAQPAAAPAGDAASLRPIFFAFAVAAVGGIVFFRRRLPSADVDPTRAATPDPTNFTTYVICWALAESVALHGLTLGLLARRLEEALPFFASGAILLVWLRPHPRHFGA
jgi:hypothetical protein